MHMSGTPDARTAAGPWDESCIALALPGCRLRARCARDSHRARVPARCPRGALARRRASVGADAHAPGSRQSRCSSNQLVPHLRHQCLWCPCARAARAGSTPCNGPAGRSRRARMQGAAQPRGRRRPPAPAMSPAGARQTGALARRAARLRAARQRVEAVLADALALHAARAERPVRRVARVRMAHHALADRAVVPLQRVLDILVAQAVEAAVAAGDAAARAVHAARRFGDVAAICARARAWR